MNAQSLISSNIQLHENDTKVFITNGTQKLLEKRRRGRGRITRRVTKFKSAVLYSIILSSPALYMLCCLQKFRVLKQNMCKEHLFESQSSRIKSQITRSIIVVGTSISSLSPSRSLRIYWTESLCMLCNFLGNECEKTSDSLFVIIESHFKRERRIELNINLHLPIEMRKMKTSYRR